MKKRYLPFGYAVRDGNIVVDTEQRTIVQNIFHSVPCRKYVPANR